MPEQEIQKELNQNKVKERGKKEAKGCLVVFLVILGVIIIGALSGSDSNKNTIKPEQQLRQVQTQPQGEVKKEEPKKEIIENGLGVSRKSIIDIFEKTGFSFEKGVAVRGKENYVGSKGNSVIQLLGNANNLSEVSILVFLGSNTGENFSSITTVASFANFIDSNSLEWITSEIEKAVASISKPYSNTKIFNKKLFKISFTPGTSFRMFSLTITPAE